MAWADQDELLAQIDGELWSSPLPFIRPKARFVLGCALAVIGVAFGPVRPLAKGGSAIRSCLQSSAVAMDPCLSAPLHRA